MIISSLFLASSFSKVDYKILHFKSVVVDAHNDIVQRLLDGEDISGRTQRGHSDLPRFIEGGIDIQVFAIWVPPYKQHRSYFSQANEQIDSIEKFVARNSDRVAIARNTIEIFDFLKQGKFVVMLGLEGGHPIEDDLEKLEHFYNRGVRYVGLTWNTSTNWATSARDETEKPKMKKGLTAFGEKVIRRMNELGMIIDLSHVGETTFWDVMKITKKPVIASHSAVWSLCRNRRNLKDEQLKAIAKNGGAVFITFVPSFLDCTYSTKERDLLERKRGQVDSIRNVFKGNPILESIAVADFLRDDYLKIRPPLSVLIDHFDYLKRLIGVDYIGIGSDFDGFNIGPLDLDDVTFFPNITRDLIHRGYSAEDVQKILGENFLRILRENEIK